MFPHFVLIYFEVRILTDDKGPKAEDVCIGGCLKPRGNRVGCRFDLLKKLFFS